MRTTIFCSFDQRDQADLTIGVIKQIPGVESIRYTALDLQQEGSDRIPAFSPIGAAFGFSNFGAGLGIPMEPNAGDSQPSQGDHDPARVQIVCRDFARKKVESALINHHGRNLLIV